MSEKKYELVQTETGLFRVKALRQIVIPSWRYRTKPSSREVEGVTDTCKKGADPFSAVLVEPGMEGGLVADENNLAQEGDCWVLPGAMIIDDARVCDDAVLYSTVSARGSSVIRDSARLCAESITTDDAKVEGKSILANTSVRGTARCAANSVLEDSCIVNDAVVIDTYLRKCIAGAGANLIYCDIAEGVAMYNCDLNGVFLSLNAERRFDIKGPTGLLVFRNYWGSMRKFYYIPALEKWSVGCFSGTSAEFRKHLESASQINALMYGKYIDLVDSMYLNGVLKTKQKENEDGEDEQVDGSQPRDR